MCFFEFPQFRYILIQKNKRYRGDIFGLQNFTYVAFFISEQLNKRQGESKETHYSCIIPDPTKCFMAFSRAPVYPEAYYVGIVPNLARGTKY